MLCSNIILSCVENGFEWLFSINEYVLEREQKEIYES
jgi:hypothetical protein